MKFGKIYSSKKYKGQRKMERCIVINREFRINKSKELNMKKTIENTLTQLYILHEALLHLSNRFYDHNNNDKSETIYQSKFPI